MKFIYLFLVLSLTIMGCKSGDKQDDGEQNSESVSAIKSASDNTPVGEKKTPAYLEQRVENIYAQVFEEYNKMNLEDEVTEMPDVDSIYCSKDWNKWVSKVNEYDSENNTDEIGFFEADYWIMGQDFSDLSISDVKTVSLNNNNAEVEINIHNFDNIIKVRLDMVFEDNDWKIDDFNEEEYGMSWKKSMKEYMKGK